MRFSSAPVLFFLLSVSGLWAADEPSWILLERGKNAFEQRQLSESLDYTLKALDSDTEFPEAEYQLGRIYQAQGQPVLAEEQYRRALSMAVYLRVPAQAVNYRYSLASLLLDRGPERRLEAESILLGLANDEGFSRPQTIALSHRYIQTLSEGGIDNLLFLYRDELDASLQAHRLLGEMAWEEGRYRSALLHSTLTVLSLLSTASRIYLEHFPDWRFDIDMVIDPKQPDRDVRYPEAWDGAAFLLQEVSVNLPDVYSWLSAEGLWEELYLLGCALYAEGMSESARSLWRLLTVENSLEGTYSALPETGIWGRLAVRQMQEPFISQGSLAP